MISRLRDWSGALLVVIAAIIFFSLGCSKSVEPKDNITITSINPSRAHAGDTVTVEGTNFGWIIGAVKFDEIPATILYWTNTQIACIVTPGPTDVNVKVQSHSKSSNSLPFIIESLTIISINPKSGPPGTKLTIYGPDFGSQEGCVIIGGISAEIESWSIHNIVAIVPGCAQSNDIIVQIGDRVSNLLPFTVIDKDNSITSLNPSIGWPGMEIAIRGSFYCSQPTAVKFGDLEAEVLSWSDTLIMAKVPQSATAGNVAVTIDGVAGNSMPFNVEIVSELMKKLYFCDYVELSFKGVHSSRSDHGDGICDTTVLFSNMALKYDWKRRPMIWAGNDFSVSFREIFDDPLFPQDWMQVDINGQLSEDGALLDNIEGTYGRYDYSGHFGFWQQSTQLSFSDLRLDNASTTDSIIIFHLIGPEVKTHINKVSYSYYWQDEDPIQGSHGGSDYFSTDWENIEHPPEIMVIFRRR